MNSIIYLLQVTACTAVFYLFYYLLLNRLTFFVTNRWYLLVTVILSFAIPLIKIPVSQPHAYTGVVEQVVYTYAPQNFVPVEATPIAQPVTVKTNSIHWGDVLKFTYLAAVLALTVHLAITLIAFSKRLKGKRITKMGNVKILSGNEKITNGSFLNYIFLNDEELSADEIQQIIAHEMLHVKLFHSVDRIIVKIAQIILWFNPFIYLYARSVEENHEFEVDRAVARDTDKHNYANLLLHLSVAGQGMLYHNFSKVPLKKRITMLFNQPSANMKKIVYVLIIPVALISCLAFARLKNNEVSKYSVIEGIEKAGKNTAVLIDGKFFAKDILYKISKSCIKAAYITFPGESVDVKGKLYYNGVVVISTNKGGITYMDDLEKENLAIVRVAEKGKLYTRVTLKNEDGSVYDKVIVTLNSGAKASSKISHNGKVGFVIDETLYNEDEFKNLSPAVIESLSDRFGVGATNKQYFSVLKNKGVKADLSGYESVFNFQTKPGSENGLYFASYPNETYKEAIAHAKQLGKRLPTETEWTIHVMKDWEKTDDYKRKKRLYDELYGKTINVRVIDVKTNEFVNDRIERVSFDYNGDNYFMSFSYGNELKTTIKPNDQLTIKISSVVFGMIKANTLEISPTEIYRGGEKIYEHKLTPDKTLKNGAVNNDEVDQLYTRSNGGSYDLVIVTSKNGTASTEIPHDGKIGFFIDRDFYTEEAFLKLSPERKAMLFNNPGVGVADAKAFPTLRKQGYQKDLTGYAAVFYFNIKLSEPDLKSAIDTNININKYRQKGTPKDAASVKNRRDALAYVNSPEGQEKSRLCKEIAGKTITATVKKIIPNEARKTEPFKNNGGILINYNGNDYLMQTWYGQTKQLPALLKAGDEITLKVFSTGFRKDAPVLVSPANIVKNNVKIYQLAEADKIPDYPFLYEGNKVRFADGQISRIEKYADGKWKSALFETVNGYKFNLNFKPTAPGLNSIGEGDHVRLRFVHEVKTAAKAYRINDWVSISTDIKDYGVKNPEMFNKFYEKVEPARSNTSTIGQDNDKVKVLHADRIKSMTSTATDSTYHDVKNGTIQLYGNVNLKFGDYDLTADYVRVDEKKQLLFASGRKSISANKYEGLPTLKANAHNDITCDSLLFNYQTGQGKFWNTSARVIQKSTQPSYISPKNSKVIKANSY